MCTVELILKGAFIATQVLTSSFFAKGRNMFFFYGSSTRQEMWFYSCSFVGPGRPGWLASCWSLHKCCHHEALSWPRHLCSWCKKRGKEKADPPLGIGEKCHQRWRYHCHINYWHHTTIPVTRVSGQCSRLHRVLLNSWLQNVGGNRNGWHCLHCSHYFHRFHCLCCLHWYGFPAFTVYTVAFMPALIAMVTATRKRVSWV